MNVWVIGFDVVYWVYLLGGFWLCLGLLMGRVNNCVDKCLEVWRGME